MSKIKFNQVPNRKKKSSGSLETVSSFLKRGGVVNKLSPQAAPIFQTDQFDPIQLDQNNIKIDWEYNR